MNAQLGNDSLVSGVAPIPAAMATPWPAAPLPRAPVGTKAVALACEGGRWSSDAGVVLLKDSDDPLGLTRALAAVLSDPRAGRRLPLTPEDLLKQRVGHIAAGDEDAHDAHTLRDAPIGKLRRARLPAPGAPWASHPTLARLANRLARTAL